VTTAKNNRVELRLPDDPRLLRAVSGAIEHFSRRVGLDAEGQQDLVAAAEEACRNTFKLLQEDDGLLCVAVQDFSDRIEVTLEHKGEPLPSAGLETFAGFGGDGGEGGDLSGLALISRVDRILYDTEGEISRMTLVKYVTPASKKS